MAIDIVADWQQEVKLTFSLMSRLAHGLKGGTDINKLTSWLDEEWEALQEAKKNG